VPKVASYAMLASVLPEQFDPPTRSVEHHLFARTLAGFA
jgi:hypothetical protein